MFKADARFLVVDDTPAAREYTRTSLNRLGYTHIDEASDGRVCLEKIQRAYIENKPYGLVFLDINMPELDGLKCLEMIRAEPRAGRLPVVIVTTESAKATVLRAVMQGVSGYIVKPFTFDDIKKKVAEIYQRVEETT
jgi:two-component system chemotaxis response regulator CheY